MKLRIRTKDGKLSIRYYVSLALRGVWWLMIGWIMYDDLARASTSNERWSHLILSASIFCVGVATALTIRGIRGKE